MADVSEAGNNCSEQETDAGRSAGMERSRAPAACPASASASASEPLLLGDTPQGAEPPAHVRRLLSWIRGDSAVVAGAVAGAAVDGDTARECESLDALVGLLLVLAVETGFTPLSSDDPFQAPAAAPCGPSAPNLRCITRMPPAWRQRRPGGPRYLVDFALGAAAADPEPPVRLVGVVCGGVLIANMVAGDATFSLGLVAEDYVGRDGGLHKLAALSRAFKDAVAVPARAAVLNARCVCNASLLGLPVDLQLLLARLLAAAAGDLRDLLHLGLTCRGLAALLDDPATWRHVARRHHPALYKELAALEHDQGADQGPGQGAHQGPVDWKDRVRREHLHKAAQAAQAARARAARRRPHPDADGGPHGSPPFPFLLRPMRQFAEDWPQWSFL